ncbi:hypothetical protein NMY22_g6519 [Coprinellus aureogranulatus]|nr:hypothetical protein NMY22_g6519 [Coprinellus aureogranulatus]
MADATSVVEAVEELRYQQITVCVTIATTALFICDYFATFEEEVAYIWPSPWRLGKILFNLTRYHGAQSLIVGWIYLLAVFENWDPTGPLQYRLLVLDNVTGLVRGYLQAGVLFLGIYALLGVRKAYKIALIVVYLAMFALSTTLMTSHIVVTSDANNPTPTSIYRIIGNYWVLCRELLILLIGGIAVYMRYKPYRLAPSGIGKPPSLLNIIRRDGLLWLFPMLFLNLWACVAYMPGLPSAVRNYGFTGE